jgi:hypothetical protein
MNATPSTNEALVTRRNQTLAKSLFRQLRAEGLTHEQIIELSGALLDQVTEELKQRDAQ